MIYAPNLVNFCVNESENGDCVGEVWHQYSREAVRCTGMVEMLRNVEKLLDEWDFPQNSTVSRSFQRQKQERVYKKQEVIRQMDAQELQEKRGDRGTFIIQVKYRQNATWQGEVVWVEKKQKQCFRSALELLKLIDSALEEKSDFEKQE